MPSPAVQSMPSTTGLPGAQQFGTISMMNPSATGSYYGQGLPVGTTQATQPVYPWQHLPLDQPIGRLSQPVPAEQSRDGMELTSWMCEQLKVPVGTRWGGSPVQVVAVSKSESEC
ncbi:hypothetical protein GUITHDRAFT_105321 [Guillardia theta CCMP2712]|uniref:Uncharacterized protein n=1 Tax=Guillardia theta (strain CCMP2712) TaxID=905079 RepID=L1JKM8_GUITC|nr:hypothetical protein GUITHDRAFT_105321 [Guillardia theta CCMP2712]EKX48689.1 hypothetical protein GUITHDRAFT_105321 [Guillardia theta CCMP2712]|eukprot:XP_005835669.1 hypothetical protein GUITHDRAFT_105321 [Guillardia theta CCMP2712]